MFCLEGYPSGQRDQTVNLTALPSKVRILLPPPNGGFAVLFIYRVTELGAESGYLAEVVDSGKACGCSSMVEQKPSKLTTRVRFPSPAPEV